MESEWIFFLFNALYGVLSCTPIMYEAFFKMSS